MVLTYILLIHKGQEIFSIFNLYQGCRQGGGRVAHNRYLYLKIINTIGHDKKRTDSG